MFRRLATRVFGSRNERVLRGLSKSVAKINSLEPRFEALMRVMKLDRYGPGLSPN